MIKEIIEKWEANKHKLEEYFRTTNQDEYGSYQEILKKIFELVINDEDEDWDNFDIDKMVVIDHGDYQGSLIFIIPLDTYQPSPDEYIVTNTYYGSCSGCDTLLSIDDTFGELPTEEQVSQYMTLALHLVQRMKWLDSQIMELKEDIGWVFPLVLLLLSLVFGIVMAYFSNRREDTQLTNCRRYYERRNIKAMSRISKNRRKS